MYKNQCVRTNVQVHERSNRADYFVRVTREPWLLGECSDFRGMGVPPVPFGTAKMAIPQEILDYIHNRVELKIHKIQITLLLG